jgi:hypothetical protein
MNLQKGDVYVCLEPCCKAEILVTKGADPSCPGEFTVRCCCGKEMVLEENLAGAKPQAASAAQPAGARK